MADNNDPVFQIQRVYMKEASLEQPNSPAILGHHCTTRAAEKKLSPRFWFMRSSSHLTDARR